MPLTYDPYTAPKAMGIYMEIGQHDFSGVNAGQIVQRILKSRAMYEERQRVKGVKGVGEEAQKRREKMEEEQHLKEQKAAA
jgi:ethanolamine-phosphate cytidylyltransferase